MGPDQRASIVTIANLLQEVASNHAVAMWGRSNEGFAADPALAELGLIFVMTRMQIQMDHYPRWGDMVQVETWFQEAGKVGAQRDWIITDKTTGRHLGRATSTWVMININTRRLSKMPESMRQRCSWYQMSPPANAIPSEFCRLKIPEISSSSGGGGGGGQTNSSIPSSRFVARRGDMDMNGHINNAVYFAWGLETVPEDVYEHCHLYQMEVDFKAECVCGDVIEAHGCAIDIPVQLAANGAGPDALTYVHSLQRHEKNRGDNGVAGEGEGQGGSGEEGQPSCTELVRARTIWKVGTDSESEASSSEE